MKIQPLALIGYKLRRAWMKFVNQKTDENTINQIPLDIDALAKQTFAIAWLTMPTIYQTIEY